MSRNTEAAILTELGNPLSLVTLDIPDLKSGQVLIDVAYSGLCHTQLLEIQGERGPDRFLPHTLGHEGSGTVIEVGPDVEKVKAGDNVVLSWIKGEGRDVPSTVYQSGGGTINSGAISTFMRQTVTCENRVIPIPDSMPLREAALLGCAIPTGAGVVFNLAKVGKGDSVAVFGYGGIGQSAILAASFAEAGVVIAIDILDSKLELARKFGATHTINALDQDPVSAVLEITEGRGVDYAIEAVGHIETMETAFRSVRDGGGLCILVGNLPFGQSISIDPFDLIKGKRIIGTWGGETRPDKDIPFFVDLHLSGRFKLDELISHIYPLEMINQGLEELKEGKVQRALIDMKADSA